MENITKCINETFFVDDEQDDLSEKEYLFKVAVRGVLNYIVQLIATFLNVSTIVVICLTSLTRAKPKEKMEFPA